MPLELIHRPGELPWDAPGKKHYDLAFHLDSSWGYSLVPITVINGTRKIDGDQPPGIAVFAGTHGNEWEGQIAAKRLCHDLDARQLAGRIIIIPQLSASACAANTRLSPLDHANMNRVFPGDKKGSISQRIAHCVKTSVFPLVRIVADLHSGGLEGGFALCMSIHAVANSSQYNEMVSAAKLFDTPFVFVYSSQMASGLLTDEAEKDGKITLGAEFGFGESVNRQGVRHAYEGVKNLLRSYGHLAESVQRIDPSRAQDPRLVSAIDLEAYVPAPRDGIWEPAVGLGESVEAGSTVGYLHDFAEHASAPFEIKAGRTGVVIMLHSPATCVRGVTLYVIARDV